MKIRVLGFSPSFSKNYDINSHVFLSVINYLQLSAEKTKMVDQIKGLDQIVEFYGQISEDSRITDKELQLFTKGFFD